MALKNRVREVRAIVGKGELSQKTLAERAGIDPSTLSDIENNRTNPNVENGLAIARALGVTVEDLFLTADTDDVSVGSSSNTGSATAMAPRSASVAGEPTSASISGKPTSERAPAVETP